MAADWAEVARTALPPSVGPQPISNPATAAVFDDFQELIWIGNGDGQVISYHGTNLQRYTSTQAHKHEGVIKQLICHEKGVVSISAKSVHLISRKGLTLWHIQDSSMLDLQCACFTSSPSHVFVAGRQKTFSIIEVEKGTIVSRHPAFANYTMAKKGRHICAATDDGKVHVLNASDYSILKIFDAHSSAVSDMDTRNDYLVTIGLRSLNPPAVDHLIRVFDLKSLNSLSIVQLQINASYIRLHPKLQTTSIVASQTGSLQIPDILNSEQTPSQIISNIQFTTGVEISQSGDAMLITDGGGFIYLWTTPGKVKFNNMSRETDFASPDQTPPTTVDWHDTPLNTVGMPYYTDRLLSAWDSDLICEIGAPPIIPDPAILQFLQPAEMGVYGPNICHGKLHRYQVENLRSGHTATSIAAPKFLSEKARELVVEEDLPALASTTEALAQSTLNGRPQTEEEKMLKYRKVEIKYSRFGVDDFDFSYFNKTHFSGLETHISNSFINALLQLYKFIPVIRNIALQHAATSCVTGTCLLCEFGFLFDMLEKASGQNCQATNLLRAFGASRDAANNNLFEKPALASGIPLSTVIQGVNRFFLREMHGSYLAMSGSADGIDDVMSTKAYEAIRCTTCNNETSKHTSVYLHELIYPPIDPRQYRPHAYPFSSILKNTIEREAKSRAWCNRCRRYQQLAIRKTITRLPFALMLNTAASTAVARMIWESRDFLPQEIGLRITDREIHCFQGHDLQLHLRSNSHNLVVYELVGFVADIDTDDQQQPHLVSIINVNVSEGPQVSDQSDKTIKNWHLFNDFLVSPVPIEEALHFNKSWKMPSVVCYQVKSGHGRMDDTWLQHLDTQLLFHEYSVNGRLPTEECQSLQPEELPTVGTPIALDTEFVDLDKAEIDVKADGSQETIRPAKSALARVSVLRGDGDNEGSPFVDDYITIYETIVDYKTQYSGIKPGDLDPHLSRHNLVPLKVAYKKLWLLLNLGCLFVGHGLASDFRKANIHVPKAQTIDTQYLYLAPGKNRRLSLKYLAWAVFKEYIQEETVDESQGDGHDSIEDARMALRLWRKFQEYEEAGIVEQMIEEIYRKGSRYGWKPPLRSGGGALAADLAANGSGSTFASGRNTPEPGLPGTPSRTAIGTSKLSAVGVDAFIPGSNKESPLR